MGKVITLHEKAPDAALERLQRLTGLDFHSWPASILEHGPVEGGAPVQPEAQPETQAPLPATGTLPRGNR
ncbi:hypothetical protein [Isoalcanivorax indicus]|uniref:hypothetical protein n=1 Tax=Isoalcanivorax indicus TaxID=2202653 RepID=UPI000DB95419|nr:hypothetical protein [Isoalcanivorax indicus]